MSDEINIDLKAEAERLDETIGSIVAARDEVAAQWAKGAPVAKIGGFSAAFESAGAVAASAAAGVTAGATLGAMIGGVGGPIGGAIGGLIGALVAAFSVEATGVVTIGPAQCPLPDGRTIKAPSCDCVTPTSTTLDTTKPWPFVPREWKPRRLVDASPAELEAWIAIWTKGVYRTIQGDKVAWWGRPKTKPKGTDEEVRAVALEEIRAIYEDTRARATILAQCLPAYASSPQLQLLAEKLFSGRFGVDATGGLRWYWSDDALISRRISTWPVYVPVGPSRVHKVLLGAADAGLTLADFERIAQLDPRLGLVPQGEGIEQLQGEPLRAYYANASAIAIAAAGQIGDLAKLALSAVASPVWVSDDELVAAFVRLKDPSLGYPAKEPKQTTTSKALWLLGGFVLVGVVVYVYRSRRNVRKPKRRSR